MSTPAETLDAEATEAAASGIASPKRRVPETLPQGSKVGRHVVLRTLGAGAMGSVYLCYDPELNRQVAVKILRGASSDGKRRDLLREAQAMAKLTHPNVVTVYDVGEHDGRVHVAMEYVQGGTLEQWLGAQRRPWRAVLEVFLLAGRGLQAAHESELIHRDFKPENVMISVDGVPRVTDFGLARPRTGTSDSDGEDSSRPTSLLTEATVGRVAGTPAYMAPEQVVASSLTPAADQFAFCVSLWEALCGQRPYEGATHAERFTNTSQGKLRAPPPDARMPGWLKRVLARGLRPQAEDRWPSLATLLAELERGRRRWRGQLALAGVVLVAVPVAVSIVSQQRRARQREQRIVACQAEGDAVDQIWNDAQRSRLKAGLLRTGARFAPRSIDTLIPWLDAYRDAWSTGRAEACVHHDVDRDWDDVTLARAEWCFEDRRLAFEATVDQIATGDAKGARRAVRLASYLEPVANCLDLTLLERLSMPPAHMRAETRSIRMTLIQSDRLRHAGRYAEAYQVAVDARLRAETLAWPPVVAAARFLEGRCLLLVGRRAEADSTLTTAYFEAQRTGSVEVAFRSARSLMRVLSGLERYGEAEIWGRHADLLSAGLDDPSRLDEAEGHYLMLTVYAGLGRYDAAAKEGNLAISIRAEALGHEHPITASAVRSLGRVRLLQGQAEAALALFDRSYAIWFDAVGREHPYVGELVCLRGEALLGLGRAEEALAALLDGLAVLEAVHDPDHPVLVRNLGVLQKAYLALGRQADAEATRLEHPTSVQRSVEPGQ